MNNILKAGCAAIYLLALASLAWPLPAGAGPVLQTLAVALIVVHALEMLFVFKHVKSYPGPLLHSVVLSLLFGLLHWLPLAKANRRAANT